MITREAGAADLAGICAVHIASWRDAYRPYLPATYLAEPVARDLGELWTELTEDDLVLVAEAQGALLGFVAFRLGAAGGPLLDNLHVDPARRGLGAGGVLMRAGAAALAARGYQSFWLTVIEQNAAARRFYKRHGGREGPPFQERLKGNPVTVRKVSWDRLPL
ncbi:MAG: GNAT family N-acetyltransferase [Pseudomonadota bacterium]